MGITAIMMIGKQREDFLPACLEGLYGAVDHIIMNDNAGEPMHANKETVLNSALYKEGRITLFESKWLGFGPCLDLCLDHLRHKKKEGEWVAYVHCDEIHPPAFRILTQELLPTLPDTIGRIDGYFYQFHQSPEYILWLSRRHRMLFRFFDDVHWELPIHEQLTNLRGETLTLPYRYYHYGYVRDLESLSSRWKLCADLGVHEAESLSQNVRQTMEQSTQRLLLFRGEHPLAVKHIAHQFEQELGPYLADFRQKVSRPLLSLESQIYQWRVYWKMWWTGLRAQKNVSHPKSIRVAIQAIQKSLSQLPGN